MNEIIEIRVCNNPVCGLRYPLMRGHKFGTRCPVCLGDTRPVLSKNLELEPVQDDNTTFPVIEGMLDNLRSAWNVGAIFRTADGLGVQKLHLCGITPLPTNPSVKKTALGAENTIPWDYSSNAVNKAKELILQGASIWALEQDERAVPINSHLVIDQHPIVLIVGNEVSGVDPSLLDLSERIIHIPMLGKKRSINVEVAFGVAVAFLRNISSR